MPKAVLRNGIIVPVEPLPAEWEDGRELVVESLKRPEDRAREADEWFREMEAAVIHVDPNDAAIIEKSIREADTVAKQQVRREMGLP
jgi:hypothetical protein